MIGGKFLFSAESESRCKKSVKKGKHCEPEAEQVIWTFLGNMRWALGKIYNLRSLRDNFVLSLFRLTFHSKISRSQLTRKEITTVRVRESYQVWIVWYKEEFLEAEIVKFFVDFCNLFRSLIIRNSSHSTWQPARPPIGPLLITGPGAGLWLVGREVNSRWMNIVFLIWHSREGETFQVSTSHLKQKTEQSSQFSFGEKSQYFH